MKILKNKKVSTVALVPVLTIAAILVACLPVAIAQEEIYFSGHVYAGEVGDESTPLNEVTVELYWSSEPDDLGTHIDSQITDNDGSYALEADPEATMYYTILVIEPINYTYAGAETDGGLEGTWAGSNGIQYYEPPPATYINNFYFITQEPPPVSIPTSAYLSVTPNPVGVNQEVSMTMWLNVTLPDEYVETQTGWSNFTVGVVDPNGNYDTLGPFNSDLAGNRSITYTPTLIGSYILVFNFLGESISSGNYYEPSTSEQVSLIVQEIPSMSYLFSGQVFAGEVGDESTPLSGVTVELYCSNDYDYLGERMDSAITDQGGWYALEAPTGFELYNILATDPIDYTYAGAETVGGLEITWEGRNGIQYEYPLQNKTLTGNNFWFTGPPPDGSDQLQINSVDPNCSQCDQNLVLTIYGDNFTPETDVFISDFIDIVNVQYINSEELEVEIYIHPDAPQGPCPVEVSNPDGQSYELQDGFNVNPPESPPPYLLIAAIVIIAGGISSILIIRHLLKKQRVPKEQAVRIEPTPPPAERIVNTGFSSPTQAGEPLDPAMPLAPGQPYYFWFEVGPPVPGSIEVKPEPLMTEFLPSDARLKVVLFAFPGEIEIKEGNDVGEIQIMPDGKVRVVRQVERPDSLPSASNFLKRRLFFPVRTPSKEGVFRMRCNIYYEQILIRSRLIQVHVASSLEKIRALSDIPALQSVIEYTMSKTLNPNYLVRMKPQSLSIMLNENSDGTHSFRLFGEKDYKSDASFNALELKSLIDKARGALRYASWEDEGPWTEGKRYRYIGYYNQDRLKADLIRFAIRGYRFYSGLTEKIAPGIPNVEKLEKLTLKPTTLEFVIKDKTEASNYMFPTTMIYDHPLDTSLNLDDYTLCPSFLKALEKKDPLEETKCFNGNCPSRGNKKVVCPSGFWGFRHSIGMPLGSAAETNHEILYTRAPELTLAVFPSFRQWPLHQKALKSLTTGVVWNLADTRAETLQYLKATNPHLVYFYCHGGVKEDIPYIKVGGKTERGITPDNLFSERVWWESPQPLIFINGCHTTALEPKNTLNFVTSFVKTHHAAGVIGTEITIFEQLACAFAEECLHRFLVKGETIGDAVRQTRLKLLKQGNPLGLVYNVYAIASLQLKKIGEAIN